METFKKITCDNGCENLDYEGTEGCINKTKPGKGLLCTPVRCAGKRG